MPSRSIRLVAVLAVIRCSSSPVAPDTTTKVLGAMHADRLATKDRLRANGAPRAVAHRRLRLIGGLTDIGDCGHFDAPSAREFGRRYADAYRTLVPR